MPLTCGRPAFDLFTDNNLRNSWGCSGAVCHFEDQATANKVLCSTRNVLETQPTSRIPGTNAAAFTGSVPPGTWNPKPNTAVRERNALLFSQRTEPTLARCTGRVARNCQSPTLNHPKGFFDLHPTMGTFKKPRRTLQLFL